MLRRRETLMWTFVMPVVFFYFIGTITGGSGMTGGREGDPIALEAPDGGWLAEHLARRLEERGYRIARVTGEAEMAKYARRVRLPAGAEEAVAARRPVAVRFERRGSGLGAEYDEIRVSRAVYSILADLIVLAERNQAPDGEALARLAAEPRNLRLAVESAGERKRIPSGFEQAVPGTLVMFTILVMFTSGSILLVIERNQGLLRRLASSPMSRGEVVLGKWGARMILGGIQIAFGVATGTVLFRVDWGAHPGALAVVLLAYGALAASLGMLLGCLARSEGQAIALGVSLANALAGLGGCWWPIEITPAWVQTLALFLPTGLAMDALHRLVSFGQGPGSVAWHVAALAGGALAAGALAARRFRFE